MAMQLSFSNLLQFFAAISPILLTFCLVMLSIFNSDIKGMVYLAYINSFSNNLLILNTLKVKSATNSTYCNLVEFPNLNEYVSPAFNSMFISFTLDTYMPMKFISVNYPVVLFISGLLVLTL